MLEEAGHPSLSLLLSRLEERSHQIHQAFVTGGEDVQDCPLDPIFLVLALGRPKHLALAQSARTPEGRPEEDHARGGLEDARPLGVGPLGIRHSLFAVNMASSPPAG